MEEAISQRKALEHDILSKETQISEVHCFEFIRIIIFLKKERRKNEYTDRKYRNEYDEFYKKTLKLAKENKELKEDLEQLAHVFIL